MKGTLVGWSGANIPGVEQQIAGTWMGRSSWANLHNADWLSSDAAWQKWVTAHPYAAADVGVPLVPHDSGQPLNGLLDEAVAGLHDNDYVELGRGLARFGPADVYARLWWEMNMSPVPAASIDRAKFRAAWARAVPLIRAGFGMVAERGQQLHIVFCPLTDGADWSEFWPGDELVDVVALDAYGALWTSATPAASTLLASVNGYLAKLAAFGRIHGKPLALGEWGNWQVAGSGTTNRGRGDFPEYIDAVFDWIDANPVAYACYFNIADGGVGQTLAQTPLSLARFKARAALLR